MADAQRLLSMDDALDFLRSIPPAERKRSKREYLAALESRAALLRHY